jgi:hypothetical protein
MNTNEFSIKVENSSQLAQDTNPTTVSEQTILNEIQDISNKISCKKTFNLNSLGNYAQILKTLEDNRTKFVEGNSIDLKPLQSFAVSADQLTCYMQSLIQRFNELSNINNASIMGDIYAHIDKINKFVSTSENLFQMMENPGQFEWFNKYNDTVMSIKNSMNAYEKIAKQITYQLSDPVNYVNPQIKGLTELFNNNYINNPLPQNFLSNGNPNPIQSIQSLPSLDNTKPTQETVITPPEPKPAKQLETVQPQTTSSYSTTTVIIIGLIIVVVMLILFIIFSKFKL